MQRDGEEEQGNGNVGKLSTKLKGWRRVGKIEEKGQQKGEGRNSLFTLYAFTLLNFYHNDYFWDLKQ